VRTALLLVTNLALGAALLGWVLHRFGASALVLLGSTASAPLLLGFLGLVVLTVASFAWRWQVLGRGLGATPRLPSLCLYRSAGHSVASLVPSGRVGGDPLRAWLAARGGAAPGDAVASVAVDRVLEVAAAIPFSLVFAALLLQRGVPELERVLVTVAVGAVGLVAGVVLALRRLRSGRGLVTSLVRGARLDRLRAVQGRMPVLEASEAAALRLAGEPRRLLVAFALGTAANLLVLAEFWLLLAAFGLPSTGLDVVAAIFATAAAHMLPVPAGIGVLEGGQMWLFGMLGHPPEVGLAVGLAARLRELVWLLPGLLYLLARVGRSSLARWRHGEPRPTEWA
jgi:uncharacterized protein (TIRG00374 family)